MKSKVNKTILEEAFDEFEIWDKWIANKVGETNNGLWDDVDIELKVNLYAIFKEVSK